MTRALIEDLQTTVRQKFPAWVVHVMLDLLPPHEDVPAEALAIHAGWIDEYWDRDALAVRFGAAFKA